MWAQAQSESQYFSDVADKKMGRELAERNRSARDKVIKAEESRFNQERDWAFQTMAAETTTMNLQSAGMGPFAAIYGIESMANVEIAKAQKAGDKRLEAAIRARKDAAVFSAMMRMAGPGEEVSPTAVTLGGAGAIREGMINPNDSALLAEIARNTGMESIPQVGR